MKPYVPTLHMYLEGVVAALRENLQLPSPVLAMLK